jgi:hypothetical protein
MALNIKPFYPKTHPAIDTSYADQFQLFEANQVKDGASSTDDGQAKGQLSSQQKEQIKNLSKEYYKKLLNVLD